MGVESLSQILGVFVPAFQATIESHYARLGDLKLLLEHPNLFLETAHLGLSRCQLFSEFRHALLLIFELPSQGFRTGFALSHLRPEAINLFPPIIDLTF